METLNKYKRLALAKAEFPTIIKDTQAFGYKYAKLEQVIDAVTPSLNKYELDIMQTVKGNAVQTYLVDLIGGSVELVGDVSFDTSVTLAKMNVYQVMGSAISYFRRYQLLAFLGLAQEDNDAGGTVAPIKIEKPKEVPNATRDEVIELFSAKEHLLPLKNKDAILDALHREDYGRYNKIKVYLDNLKETN